MSEAQQRARSALPLVLAPHRSSVLALRPPPALRARSERTRAVDRAAPLQRMSIELARRCNLRCTYCYTEATPDHEGGLTDARLREIVTEAVGLGARLVSIVGGGEPLLRESMLVDGASLIDHANALGCYCTLYTNCTLLRGREARWLASRDVSVVGKLNSLRDEVQDALAGVPGSARRIRRGIDALLEEGMAGEGRLALETVICPQNYDELPEMWRWMRQRGIVPEVEIPTVHGRAADNRESLTFAEAEAPAKYATLFDELLRIDRAEFGFDWIPHPPFPAGSCVLFETNCYVNERGGVQPCAGVDRELGVLGEGTNLRDVVTSPAFVAIRGVRARVEEPCRSCDLVDVCYGCRGAAYQATGDMFAADPVCWRQPRAMVEAGCDRCAGAR